MECLKDWKKQIKKKFFSVGFPPTDKFERKDEILFDFIEKIQVQ